MAKVIRLDPGGGFVVKQSELSIWWARETERLCKKTNE